MGRANRLDSGRNNCRHAGYTGFVAYCLFQASSDPLDDDAVLAALVEVEALDPHERRRIRPRLALGVLADALREDQALALRDALARRGLATIMVPQRWLELPIPTRLKRAIPDRDGLTVFDLHGLARAIPWTHVQHLAVHCEPGDSSGANRTLRAGSGLEPSVLGDYPYKKGDALSLEVFGGRPHRRFVIEASAFDYGYLGPRLDVRTTANFGRLVSDLLRLSGTEHVASTPYRDHLPASTTANVGARTIARDPDRAALYPSRRHFEREIAWTLWRHHGAGAALP